MSNPKRLFSAAGVFLLVFVPLAFASGASPEPKPRQASFYSDFFDKAVYEEFTRFLRLDRVWRDITGNPNTSEDINIYDEVPDSPFFTNRNGRAPLSLTEVRRGPDTGEGPAAQGRWIVTKGKAAGISPGLFIRDARGDAFLLKFDPPGSLEMATGAEAVASRLMHAIGYNVPQYTVEIFPVDRLQVDPKAAFYDEDGFEKPFTEERLVKFLKDVPRLPDGSLRASASKLLKGKPIGPFSLNRRWRDASNDQIRHRLRREFRALTVFSSWLNNHDLRKGNTLGIIADENGKEELRYYLIDFGSSLGSAAIRPKPPQIGHEHIIDYGLIFRRLFTLGLWQSPWEARWKKNGKRVANPAVGYFDNVGFDPIAWRPSLQTYSFSDRTDADAFWAARIIMSFTDAQIRSAVEAGKYSDPQAAEMIARTLSERRDLIGRAWFGRVSPLDDFSVVKDPQGGWRLEFTDLGTASEFFNPRDTQYRFQAEQPKGKRGWKKTGKPVLTRGESDAPLPEGLEAKGRARVSIQARRDGQKRWRGPNRVVLRWDGGANAWRVAGIDREGGK